MKGKVYLVGAGPGDVGLLTLRGLECIKEAEVIIYDALVNQRLLSFAKSGAELVYVGKISGKHTLSQNEINQLLVKKANEGKMVVRLKGGDPFIFGRGGEEAEFLVDRGVPFEVVPGVTSSLACPSFAGIPLTQRGITSSLTILTGQEDPTKESSIDWKRMATLDGTIVILMGAENLAEIAKELIRAGKQEDTPIAVIRWGTTPRQETIVSTLKEIIKEDIAPPAVIVIGEVVRLREKLAWFEKKPLFGKTFLITRASKSADELSKLLEEQGACVIEFPTIKIEPLLSFEKLDEVIENISRYDWLIFTSANGVNSFFCRLMEKADIRCLAGIRVCVIGPATKKAVERMGIKVELEPKEFRAEGIIEAIKGLDIVRKRILILRSEEAREILPETLRDMGALVDVVPVYRTTMPETDATKIKELLKNFEPETDATMTKEILKNFEPETDATRIKEMLKNSEIELITFTSPSCAKNFCELIEEKRLWDKVKVACIGPITEKKARELGFNVEIVAKEYTISGLVKEIILFSS
ncbi:uroporphyrinogen-III C-methyltransferase [bacterium]|nr:uroporphyrinogen-III C-methyltransferase [bacterium]